MKKLVVGLLIGALLALGYDRRPRPADQYDITTKTACLPADGFTFTLKYSGTGVASFHVQPPQTPAKGKEEKK